MFWNSAIPKFPLLMWIKNILDCLSLYNVNFVEMTTANFWRNQKALFRNSLLPCIQCIFWNRKYWQRMIFFIGISITTANKTPFARHFRAGARRNPVQTRPKNRCEWKQQKVTVCTARRQISRSGPSCWLAFPPIRLRLSATTEGGSLG